MALLRELVSQFKIDVSRAKREMMDFDKAIDDSKKSLEDAEKGAENLGKASAKAATATRKSGRTIGDVFRSIGQGAKRAAGFARTSFGMIAKGVAAVTGVITAAGAAVTSFTVGFANTADEVGKSAQKLGVAASELQELRFAAELSGASAGALRGVLKDLQIRATDAVTNGVGPFVDAANELGLDFEELAKKSPVAAFEEIVEALSKVENSQKRTGLATRLLGEQSVELGALVEAGADGLAKMRQEARELGVVIDEETLAEAAELNDELTRLRAIAKGVAGDLFRSLSPAVRGNAKDIRELIRQNRELIATRVGEFLRSILEVSRELGPVIVAVAKGTGDLVDAVGGIGPALKIAAGGFVAFKLAALGPIGAVAGALVALGVSVDVISDKLLALERKKNTALSSAFEPAQTELSEKQLQQTEIGREILKLQKQREQLAFRITSETGIGPNDTVQKAAIEAGFLSVPNEVRARRDELLADLKRIDDQIKAGLEELRHPLGAPAATGDSGPVFGLLTPAQVEAMKRIEGRKTASTRRKDKKKKGEESPERPMTIAELFGLPGTPGGALTVAQNRQLGTTIQYFNFHIGAPRFEVKVESSRNATVQEQARKTADAIRTSFPEAIRQARRAAASQTL